MNRGRVKWHEALVGAATRKLDWRGEDVYCIYTDYGPVMADGRLMSQSEYPLLYGRLRYHGFHSGFWVERTLGWFEKLLLVLGLIKEETIYMWREVNVPEGHFRLPRINNAAQLSLYQWQMNPR